jgi:hypothetical protein
MRSITECYAELLSLTQLFLLREHALTDIRIADPTLLAFFRKKIAASPSLHQAKKTEITTSTPLQTSQRTPMPERSTSLPPSPDPRPPETRPEPLPSPTLPPPTKPGPSPPDPQPPVIQDKSRKISRDSKKLDLEPLAEPLTFLDHRDFWKLFSTLFPELTLCESVPHDGFAKKLKNAWLNDQVIPPVIILSFQDGEKQLTFLKNLAQAISLRLAPARVLSASKLEKEKGWENILKTPTLRLVIASDYGLYLQPGLMHFYREIPKQGKHFLNHIPLLLLSDISLYLKEPQLKSLMWRAICNEFAASQHPSVR